MRLFAALRARTPREARGADLAPRVVISPSPPKKALFRRLFFGGEGGSHMVAAAKFAETIDRVRAITLYQEALVNLGPYATLTTDAGIVGENFAKHRQQHGISGDLRILDRLTLLLIKEGRVAEAQCTMTSYFSLYRGDPALVAAEKIRQRVAKA